MQNWLQLYLYFDLRAMRLGDYTLLLNMRDFLSCLQYICVCVFMCVYVSSKASETCILSEHFLKIIFFYGGKNNLTFPKKKQYKNGKKERKPVGGKYNNGKNKFLFKSGKYIYNFLFPSSSSFYFFLQIRSLINCYENK